MFKRHEQTNKAQRGADLLPCRAKLPLKIDSVAPAAERKQTSSAVLSAANRFPYSSTPAVSPSQHLKTKSGLSNLSQPKENVKQPIVDHSSGNMSNIMLKPFVSDCSVAISPIRGGGMENNPEVCLTQYQQRRLRTESEQNSIILLENACKRDMDNNGMVPHLSSTMISQVGKSGKHHVTKVPYPFPDVTAYDSTDRDSTLLRSLKILQTVRISEIEKRKYEDRKKGLVPPSGKGNKKKRDEDRLPGFMLTKGMFHIVNSQACLHVLHLLFECYDWKEADTMFRDVWPVFDKKMEGLFRRVALKWLRDIIESHPLFFSGIKLEALGGLLVNPGGERFVQLIECFTELVIFRVMKNNQDYEDVTYEKPNFTNDSEITNMQILTMAKKTKDLFKNTLLHRKKILINSEETCNRLKRFANRKQMWLNTRNNSIKRVNNLLITRFGNQDSFGSFNIVEKPQLLPFAEPIEGNLVKINAVVHKALETQTTEALQVVTAIQEAVKKYQRLWFVLEMDRSQERVLDGSKLYFLDNGEGLNHSMKDFIKGVGVICDEFIQDKSFNAPIPNSILRDFKSADLKFEYLKLVHEEMKKQNTNNDFSSLKESLDGKITLLKLQLMDVNWREFSKVNDEKLSTALLLTPTKRLDFSKRTGYTPGLINFLNTGKLQTPGGPHPTRLDTSQLNVSTAQLNDSQRISFFANRDIPSNTSTNVCLTPVSRFNSSLLNEKHGPPRVRLSGSSKPQVSFQENDPPISPSVTVTASSETEELENRDLNDSQEQSLIFNRSIADVSVSDSSLRSDVSAPIGLGIGVQARIARIMGSLTRSVSASSTHSDHPESDREDCETEGDTISEMNLDNSVAENNKRLSVSSIRTNYSEFNRSLLDEWSNEKGIMDMSFNDNLDDSDIVG